MHTMSRRTFVFGLSSLGTGALLAPKSVFAQSAPENAGTQADAATTKQVTDAARHWVHLFNANDPSVVDLTVQSDAAWGFFFFANSNAQAKEYVSAGNLPRMSIYQTANVRGYADASVSIDVTYTGFDTSSTYLTQRWGFVPDASGTLILTHLRPLPFAKIKGHTYGSAKLVLSQNGMKLSSSTFHADILLLDVQNRDQANELSTALYPLPAGVSPQDEWNSIIQDYLPDGYTQTTKYLVVTPVDPGKKRGYGVVVERGRYILTLWSIDGQNKATPMQGDQFVLPITVK